MADPATQAIIEEFDLMSEGYTIIVPRNMAPDPSSTDGSMVTILEAFNITIADLTEEEATMVCSWLHRLLCDGARNAAAAYSCTYGRVGTPGHV